MLYTDVSSELNCTLNTSPEWALHAHRHSCWNTSAAYTHTHREKFILYSQRATEYYTKETYHSVHGSSQQ
jgi:hypothetical protein